MNKILIILVFGIMVLAQLFVPGNMIYQQEAVLTEGTAYKFKTRPIDPTDPLRGKYIYLDYQMNFVAANNDSISYGDTIHVYIENDENGFAVATKASKTPLDTEQDYIITTANNSYDDSVHFDLPFNIFYMEESKAYEAEVYVREANRDADLENCYGLVYIKGDKAVLNDVIVNNMSIKDYVLQERLE